MQKPFQNAQNTFKLFKNDENGHISANTHPNPALLMGNWTSKRAALRPVLDPQVGEFFLMLVLVPLDLFGSFVYIWPLAGPNIAEKDGKS